MPKQDCSITVDLQPYSNDCFSRAWATRVTNMSHMHRPTWVTCAPNVNHTRRHKICDSTRIASPLPLTTLLFLQPFGFAHGVWLHKSNAPPSLSRESDHTETDHCMILFGFFRQLPSVQIFFSGWFWSQIALRTSKSPSAMRSGHVRLLFSSHCASVDLALSDPTDLLPSRDPIAWNFCSPALCIHDLSISYPTLVLLPHQMNLTLVIFSELTTFFDLCWCWLKGLFYPCEISYWVLFFLRYFKS